MWSGVELSLAIICASGPALKPGMKRLFPRLWGNSTNPRSGSQYNFTSGTYNRDGLKVGTNHTLDAKATHIEVTRVTEIDDVVGKEHNVVDAREDSWSDGSKAV